MSRINDYNSSNATAVPVVIVQEGSGLDREISLVDVWRDIWDGKWLIFFITTITALTAVAYVLLATEWYRATMVLAPADERSMQQLPAGLGGLAGLAGLAGIRGGGGDSEALARLRSRDFAQNFIEDNALITVLLYDQWDAGAGRWRASSADKPLDVRDAIEFFDKKVFTVTEDAKTSTIKLTVDWIDPEIASAWATQLVTRINADMKSRALSEAKTNVNHLKAELSATNLTTLRESIGTLLETELQKEMLARGAEEFAFKIIDSAQVPKDRQRPKRALIVVLSTFLGGFLAVVLVLVRGSLRREGAATAE